MCFIIIRDRQGIMEGTGKGIMEGTDKGIMEGTVRPLTGQLGPPKGHVGPFNKTYRITNGDNLVRDS